jgi:hypothetical protein
MARTVDEFPAYVFDPVRQAAVFATNTRSGKPNVEVRCATAFRKGICGRLLGGAWIEGESGVVIVTRLGFHDSAKYYKAISYGRTAREQEWQETGFVEEEPVLLLVDGAWRLVPGSDERAMVVCPRHGGWPLDVLALLKKVGVARATRSPQRYGSRRT